MEPLETIEQQILVKYLISNDYKFTSIPNNTYTKSFAQKRKNKAEGLNPGLPDLLIILKSKKLLFIELKRAKKSLSKVSEFQKDWIEKLNEVQNIQAEVCYGYKQAIELIERLEKINN